MKFQNKMESKKIKSRVRLTLLLTLLSVYLSLGHIANLKLPTFLYSDANYLWLVWIMILIDSALFIINKDYFEKRINRENEDYIILDRIIGIASIVGFVFSFIVFFLFLSRALCCEEIPLKKEMLCRSLIHFESTGIILTIGNCIKYPD